MCKRVGIIKCILLGVYRLLTIVSNESTIDPTGDFDVGESGWERTWWLLCNFRSSLWKTPIHIQYFWSDHLSLLCFSFDKWKFPSRVCHLSINRLWSAMELFPPSVASSTTDGKSKYLPTDCSSSELLRKHPEKVHHILKKFSPCDTESYPGSVVMTRSLM